MFISTNVFFNNFLKMDPYAIGFIGVACGIVFTSVCAACILFCGLMKILPGNGNKY